MPAIAIYQSLMCRLIHRYRRQASSHSKSLCSIEIFPMNEFLNLQGYGPMLAQGAWMTVKLAFLALALSLALGLIAAGAKLSSVKWLRVPATLYTTLIRSVPDLVLILLIRWPIERAANARRERKAAADAALAAEPVDEDDEIGRASCRERV